MDKNVLKNLSYGMYVVGSADSKNAGCVCNTVIQISSNPIIVVVSINRNNYTNEVIKKSKKFSVSILDEGVNPSIIGVFGYKSSIEIDKFYNVDYSMVDGVPILNNTCGNMICNVVETIETSTHMLFMGEVVKMLNYSEKRPMTYRYFHEVLKGRSPKNAPTFSDEVVVNRTIWKCSVCGYEVEADELPMDFVCPICGQSVNVFEKKN